MYQNSSTTVWVTILLSFGEGVRQVLGWAWRRLCVLWKFYILNLFWATVIWGCLYYKNWDIYNVYFYLYTLYSILLKKWDRASCSLGWPQTHYVGENNLELQTLLPLLPNCWEHRCVPLCPVLYGAGDQRGPQVCLPTHSINWASAPPF